MISPSARLARLLEGPEPALNVAEAALVIAQQEYPELEAGRYLRELDLCAQQLRRRLPADAAKAHAIAMLNHYLFSEQGYTGNEDDYYDPRNSFLNEVIDRRIGIPITLSIVYIEIGRRLGLPLAGVSFPGHFLVKCKTDQGLIVVDPYNCGVSLSENNLRQRLEGLDGAQLAAHAPLGMLLKTAGKREILVRLARNLKAIYVHDRRTEKALAMINLILMIKPDLAQETRERGVIYHKLECFRAALDDLQRYVQLDPGAEDDAAVQNLICELRHKNYSLH